jgi:cell division protein ZapB
VPEADAYNAATAHLPARAMSKIEELAERVERLLLRHVELQRTNALLEQQLATVAQERDSLRSRLTAARSRIDTLLERLPAEAASGNDSGSAT